LQLSFGGDSSAVIIQRLNYRENRIQIVNVPLLSNKVSGMRQLWIIQRWAFKRFEGTLQPFQTGGF